MAATRVLVLLVLLLRISIPCATLPTLGDVDKNRLETYEEASTDPFLNFDFRFGCDSRPVGLYADPDYDCRVFHVCDGSGSGFPVLCPNGTVFDQRERICSDEGVDCEHAQDWFYLNELPYELDRTEDYEPRKSSETEEVPSVQPLLSY